MTKMECEDNVKFLKAPRRSDKAYYEKWRYINSEDDNKGNQIMIEIEADLKS